jgi:hypothetical protein
MPEIKKDASTGMAEDTSAHNMADCRHAFACKAEDTPSAGDTFVFDELKTRFAEDNPDQRRNGLNDINVSNDIPALSLTAKEN